MSEFPTGTVTFLFTDIEGSTQLWEKHPEEMKSALAKHDSILKEAIESNHGHIIKTTGDGVHAVFEKVFDSVNATIQAQRNLSSSFISHPFDSAQDKPSSLSLKVRMGLHTGEAELRDGDYYGNTLNRAARIMSAGHGGQVLISSITSDLLRDQLQKDQSLLDLGEHHLKGLLLTEKIFQLVSPGLEKVFPSLNSISIATNNLPTQLTSFIGRERERNEVNEKLKSSRLMTLIGPGGTGKTRLSIQVAEDQLPEFKDGVWFVELAPLSDPKLIMQSIAAVFNVRTMPGMSLQDNIINFLRAKNLLLILDNCEHMVEACAQLTDQILRSSPQLKIMISSREAIGINGETIYRVPSLNLPDPDHVTAEALMNCESVQLFAERARAANPKFELTEKNASFIAQICLRLDGIPLALELAAARAVVFSCEQIATRLNDRFKLLTGGSRTALPRQQTLRALIDWSYDLLSEDERSLLQKLSVFAGGWTFEAAEAMCPNIDVLTLLTQLVNKSLVIVEEGADTRYRLLETIRQYSRDKLSDIGGLEEARNTHLDYFAKFAEVSSYQIENQRALDWIPRLDPEYDNFRIAFEWGLDANIEKCLRLVGHLALYWFLRGHGAEGIQMANTALARAESLPKPIDENESRRQMQVRAKALEGISFLSYSQGDNESALKAVRECIPLARELKDSRMLSVALAYSGSAKLFLGDLATASADIEEAVNIARSTGEKFGLGMALGMMAQLAVIKDGDFKAAQAYEEEGLLATTEVGNTWASSMIIFGTARGAMFRGDYAPARERFRKSLPFFEEMKDEHRVNMVHSEFAHIDRYEGRYAESHAGYRKTILIWQKLGHRAAVAHQLECFGFLAITQSNFTHAARLYGAAEALRAKINISMNPTEKVEYQKEVEKVTAGINNEKLFDSAWADGRSMTMEQAIELALKD